MWSIQIPETHKEQCMTNVAPHFKSPFSQASAADAHLPLYLEDLHSRPYWSSRAGTAIVTKGPSTPFFPKSFFAPIHTSQFPFFPLQSIPSPQSIPAPCSGFQRRRRKREEEEEEEEEEDPCVKRWHPPPFSLILRGAVRIYPTLSSVRTGLVLARLTSPGFTSPGFTLAPQEEEEEGRTFSSSSPFFPSTLSFRSHSLCLVDRAYGLTNYPKYLFSSFIKCQCRRH